jgi:hypothetical protein
VTEDKTSEFSREERDLLDKLIGQAHIELNADRKRRGEFQSIMGALSGNCNGISLKKLNLPGLVWNILVLPIEEVPLHINDESPYARGTAIWRLKLGR